jgi:hypothetical protein
MKLRVRDNTLRLRLTRSEVEALQQGTPVEARTLVAPGQVFTYRIEVAGTATLAATFSGGVLVVRAPGETVQAWAAGEDEGMSGEQPVAGSEPLKITVEKDFACLKPRDPAEDRDAFPHPRAAC